MSIKLGDHGHGKKSNELLLTRLENIQRKKGFISEEDMKELSEDINILITDIYQVATFYSFINTENRAEHVIRVCNSPTCHINGSENILSIIEELLKIKPGQITSDNKFRLEKTSCIGCCNEAPAMMIDNNAYTKLNKEKIQEILSQWK